jgi:DNA polymerase III epsilon subunit-like protein
MDFSQIRKPKDQKIEIANWDQTFVFDIETMGVPSKVKEHCSYPAFQEPKYGNLKDPIKREQFYQQKKEEWENAEADWWQKQIDRSALDSTTGRIVAIGYVSPYAHTGEESLWDKMEIDGISSSDHDACETRILNNFWKRFNEACVSYGHIIGHNIEKFDLPFIMQRSWQLGIRISPMIMNGRYYHRQIIDTMKLWTCYAFNEYISLDKLAKILSLGKKMDNYEAVQFAQDWLGGDKETAEFYLKTDLDLTYKIYERLMGGK